MRALWHPEQAYSPTSNQSDRLEAEESLSMPATLTAMNPMSQYVPLPGLTPHGDHTAAPEAPGGAAPSICRYGHGRGSLFLDLPGDRTRPLQILPLQLRPRAAAPGRAGYPRRTGILAGQGAGMPRRVPSQQTLYAAFLFLSAAQAYTSAHKRMIKHIIIYIGIG